MGTDGWEDEVAGLLADSTVIVTGGARGIGRAVAYAIADAGGRVAVVDLPPEPDDDASAEAVASAIDPSGERSMAINASVTTFDAARVIVDTVVERWGALHGLVCCAGVPRHRVLLEMSEEDWDLVITTHLKGHFVMFRHAAAAMVESGIRGSLVALGSSYLEGTARKANYRAAKAGVLALTKTAALELADHGIRANLVAPAANTRLTIAEGVSVDGDPEDVAPLVVYLLSHLSRSVSGQIISIAGREMAAWADPHQDRLVVSPSRWTPEQIAREMPFLMGDFRVGMPRPPAST